MTEMEEMRRHPAIFVGAPRRHEIIGGWAFFPVDRRNNLSMPAEKGPEKFGYFTTY